MKTADPSVISAIKSLVRECYDGPGQPEPMKCQACGGVYEHHQFDDCPVGTVERWLAEPVAESAKD